MNKQQKAWAEKHLKNLTYSQVGKKYKGHPNFFGILSAWSETHRPSEASVKPVVAQTPEKQQTPSKPPVKAKTVKITLKEYILKYLSENLPNYVHKGEIENKIRGLGFLAETTGRKCRELEAEGKIISIKNDKGQVSYRYNNFDSYK